MDLNKTVKPLINLKLKFKPLTIKTSDEIEESKYAQQIVNHFFKERSSLPNSNGVITKEERIKNLYLAKLFYRKVKLRNLDIEFIDGVDIEKFYRELEDPVFLNDKVSFMFKYADSTMLNYYSQTINGAIGFYFKHYIRLKAVINTPSITSEEKQLIATIRQWKKEDAINVFHLYIAKIYLYSSGEKFNPQQVYYRYIKYLRTTNNIPTLLPTVINNSHILRGLLFQFEEMFSQFALIKAFDINLVFDYTAFKKICEESGADFEPTVFENKDLNDVISEAMYKFYKL